MFSFVAVVRFIALVVAESKVSSLNSLRPLKFGAKRQEEEGRHLEKSTEGAK